MIMKEKYEAVEMEIAEFETEDIITTSNIPGYDVDSGFEE